MRWNGNGVTHHCVTRRELDGGKGFIAFLISTTCFEERQGEKKWDRRNMRACKESTPLWNVGFENCNIPIAVYDVVERRIIFSNKATKSLEIEELDLPKPLDENTSEGHVIRTTVSVAKKHSGDDGKQLPANVFQKYTNDQKKLIVPCSVTVLSTSKQYPDCVDPHLLLEISLPQYSTGRDTVCFLDYTSDGFWDWYPECDYEYISPFLWRIFGYDPAEMPHKPSAWQSIMHPQDLEKTKELLDQHVKSRGIVKYIHKCRLKHKQGGWVTVICRGTVVEWLPGWAPWRMVGTLTDVSEPLCIQYSMAREKLIAQLSHDLKTPLCVLIAICDMQFKLFDSRGSSRKHQDITNNVKQADEMWESQKGCFETALQHLVELTNDLQYIANDESKCGRNFRNSSNGEEIDMHALFLRTCECIQVYSKVVRTSIEVSIDTTNVPRYVRADKRAIARVIYNLGSNAVRHGSSDPEDHISTHPVRIHLHLAKDQPKNEDCGKEAGLGARKNEDQPEEHSMTPQGQVRVELVVSNSSKDLSEDTIEKMKSQHASLYNAKNAHEGACSDGGNMTPVRALGMSIVYDLLNSMDGDIAFSIDKSTGVEWVCTLPLEVVEEATSESISESSRKVELLEDYMHRCLDTEELPSEKVSSHSTVPTPLDFIASTKCTRSSVLSYFPCSEETAILSHTESTPSEESLQPVGTEEKKGSILIVEDTRIVSRLLCKWMRADEWDCVTAVNGIDAINIAREEEVKHFDFVLLDLCMPDMDGFQFLQHLKDKGRPRALMNSRVVVTSAGITSTSWKKLHDLGAFGHIDKPYRHHHIHNFLCTAMETDPNEQF